MTHLDAKTAIRQAAATAAGVPLARVLWTQDSVEGAWSEFPRVKLSVPGSATPGIPFERTEWDAGAGILRVKVWSLFLVRVTFRIETDRAGGFEAPFAPSDRVAKVLRTSTVSEALSAAGVSLVSVGEFGPFALDWGERELSATVAECLFQVNIPLDITPEGGADWFNRVQVRGTLDGADVIDTTIGPP